MIQPTPLLCPTDLQFTLAERACLRMLAAQVAELAARPIEAAKRELWTRHNRLEATRPVIFCSPENSWNEIIPAQERLCLSPLARQWEMHLRQEIFWGTRMNDDYTIQPFFDVNYLREEPDWGLHQTQVGGQNNGAYRWDAPIHSLADLDRLHAPILRVDFEGTQQVAALAEDTLGDLLPVRLRPNWYWSFGLTRVLVLLRGLEQMLFDMSDAPEMMHRLMALLSQGTNTLLDELQAQNLLSLNCDGAYVGSGGLGWSDELPQPDFNGQVRTQDMWGLSESQETVGVSPRMFAEFVFPYQLPILQRFGLTCYGCCEPVDARWQTLQQIPNLRRVSISPWSNRAKMAECLGERYIFSMKPNPADLAMESFDEDRIRATLRADLRAARGCRVEVIMKDNHTLRGDPTRATRWVQIAREEAEAL